MFTSCAQLELALRQSKPVLEFMREIELYNAERQNDECDSPQLDVYAMSFKDSSETLEIQGAIEIEKASFQ